MTLLKKTISIIFALLIGLGFTSCGENDDEPKQPGTETEGENYNLQIAVYPVTGDETDHGLIPRMIMKNGDWTCVELFDLDQPEHINFHIFKTTTGESVLMTVNENSLFIASDKDGASVQEAALFRLENDKSFTAIGGTWIAETKKFAQTSIAHISPSKTESDNSRMSPSRYKDDMDFARELMMKNIVSPLEQAHSDASDISFLLKIKTLDPYFSTMDWIVFPVMKLQLYSNNPEKLKKVAEGKISDGIKTFVLDKTIPLFEDLRRRHRMCMRALEITKPWDWYFDETPSKPSDDVDDVWYNLKLTDYDNKYRAMTDNVRWIYDYRVDAELSCSVSDITENSAVLSMNTTQTGYYTDCGYVVNDGNSTKTYSCSFGEPLQLSRLSADHEYAAYAFATLAGVHITSNIVKFRPLVAIGFEPEALAFDLAGGTQKVTANLPNNKWTISVADAPSWCNVTVKGNTLTVKASATTAPRNGEVKAYIYAPDGEGIEKSINIVQANMNMMMFSGTIHSTRTGNTPFTDVVTTEKSEIKNYPFMLQRSGSDIIILVGGSPTAGVVFKNWKISNTKPEDVEGNIITAFSTAKSGNKVTIKGKTSNKVSYPTTADFEIIIDLSAGTIKLKESSTTTYTTKYGGSSKTTAEGTLSLQSDYSFDY